jgi:hypothetical protein
MMTAKKNPEFEAFTKLMDSLLSVPKAELAKREEEYRRQADANPRKRGPKPKVKASAAHDPASET